MTRQLQPLTLTLSATSYTFNQGTCRRAAPILCFGLHVKKEYRLCCRVPGAGIACLSAIPDLEEFRLVSSAGIPAAMAARFSRCGAHLWRLFASGSPLENLSSTR